MGGAANLLGPGSGRPPKEIDMEAALDLMMRGESIPTIATELGISPPTLRKRIDGLSEKQGLLLQYREIQSLHLTELQARILEAITPDKIDSATLKDLVSAFKILKDKEQVIEGKPSEIKGLVAHLVHMEKQEAVLASGSNDIIEAQYSDEVISAPPDPLAALAELDETNF